MLSLRTGSSDPLKLGMGTGPCPGPDCSFAWFSKPEVSDVLHRLSDEIPLL